MVALKVPSLQHLARNWRETPQLIQKELVKVAVNPPIFNYNPLIVAAEEMLLFGQPLADVEHGIKRKEKREKYQKDFLQVAPLMHQYFSTIKPDAFQRMDHSFYALKQGLLIPFNPLFIYKKDDKFIFPWLSFWKRNPLSGKRLSLFATIVEEMLLQEPDLEHAEFQILDFSAADAKSTRALSITDAREIPRLSQEEKIHMLEIFVEGYRLAQIELADVRPQRKDNKPHAEPYPENQYELFANY